MKNFITCSLLLIILTCANLFSQNTQYFKTVKNLYCVSTEKPIKLFTGDTIAISCDTMYLINKSRYKFYKKIHTATQENNNDICNKLISVYENNLKEREHSYNKLLKNCNEAEKITRNILMETQKTLIKSENTLNNTQQKLTQTSSDLKKANKLLKKQKWNTIKQKLLIGGSGIAIGLLAGLLIAN